MEHSPSPKSPYRSDFCSKCGAEISHPCFDPKDRPIPAPLLGTVAKFPFDLSVFSFTFACPKGESLCPTSPRISKRMCTIAPF